MTDPSSHVASSATELPKARGSSEHHPHSVAIVGPPNSGKSTLFNQLTGLRQKIANYPGVTVEQRVGKVRLASQRQINLVDLPGVYSLDPRSEDERVTRDVLMGRMPGVRRPEAVILILDSTNLARHLVLAAPVLSLGVPTLVVLNMADSLRARGGEVDTVALAQQLGTPVVLTSAVNGEGIEPVLEFLTGQFAVPKPVDLPIIQDIPRCRRWATRVGNEAAYRPPAPPVWTRRLDDIFLHPVAGPLIFGVVIVAVFQTVFAGAQPLIEAVEFLVSRSGQWLGMALPDSPLRDLLVQGVWGGVGAVVVFLPQILLLFLFLGLLEDTGYLARAAIIVDRTMARVGLQGKSFIPLLSAYACAVPAIMATRTIESRRDRIATILIAPFMTCSARLPVYTLFIAAFIPEGPLLTPFVSTRTAAMIGLYVLGFLAAVVTARLLKSSILKSGKTPFMLEMPPYRRPTPRSVGLRLYDRSKIFLHRVGTVVLIAAIVLWVLSHLPLIDGAAPPIEHSVAGAMGHTIEPLIRPLGFNWKIGVGLVSSLAAREVIVGTLGTIYGIEGDEGSGGLRQALRRDLTPGGAVALLVFFAFAMQCMATLAAVRRETGGWKWPILQFTYMGTLAYTAAFIANRLVTAWIH